MEDGDVGFDMHSIIMAMIRFVAAMKSCIHTGFFSRGETTSSLSSCSPNPKSMARQTGRTRDWYTSTNAARLNASTRSTTI